jgi:hypothetical protein
MTTWDGVRRAALALPEVTEKGEPGGLSWAVRGKTFLWERPLRKGEVLALGGAMRDAPVLGSRTADEGVKRALIADDPAVFFTTPHFDGYAAVLVWLDRIDDRTLDELATDAWLRQAPKRLAAAFLAAHQ